MIILCPLWDQELAVLKIWWWIWNGTWWSAIETITQEIQECSFHQDKPPHNGSGMQRPGGVTSYNQQMHLFELAYVVLPGRDCQEKTVEIIFKQIIKVPLKCTLLVCYIRLLAHTSMNSMILFPVHHNQWHPLFNKLHHSLFNKLYDSLVVPMKTNRPQRAFS